jgi:MFS family permease
VMTSIMALSTDLVDPVDRGKVVGFRNFVGYVAMGFAMLLGNYLFLEGTRLGIPQLPFYTAFLVVVPMLVIVLSLIHENPRPRT